MHNVRTRMLAVAVLAVPLLAGAGKPLTSTSWASAGSVDAMIDEQHIVTGELAKCTADGPMNAHTAGGTTGDIAIFGNGTTTCGRNGPVAVAEAQGHRFEADVLKRFGGPVITVRTYKSGCATTADGSVGDMEVGTVTGIKVPQDIPPNFRIVIPGGAAGTALATVTVNETVTPEPVDGSMVTHAVHIKLFPQGGPASGDIYVGTAACDPFGSGSS